MTNPVAQDARLAVELREEAEVHKGRLYRMLRAAAYTIERLQNSVLEPAEIDRLQKLAAGTSGEIDRLSNENSRLQHELKAEHDRYDDLQAQHAKCAAPERRSIDKNQLTEVRDDLNKLIDAMSPGGDRAAVARAVEKLDAMLATEPPACICKPLAQQQHIGQRMEPTADLISLLREIREFGLDDLKSGEQELYAKIDAACNHQAIANYIAKARQNERFAKFFEWMMLNDMSAEYDVHTHDILNDPRYDKTYLCVYIEKAMEVAGRAPRRSVAQEKP